MYPCDKPSLSGPGLSSRWSPFGSTDKDTKQRVSRERKVGDRQKGLFSSTWQNGGKYLCRKQKQRHVRKDKNGNSGFLEPATEMKQSCWEAQGIDRAAGLLPTGIRCVPGL